MFMQRIEVPDVKIQRPRPTAATLILGVLFILVSAAVMVPYLAAFALWVAVIAAGQAIAKLAAAAFDIVAYAGEVVGGR